MALSAGTGPLSSTTDGTSVPPIARGTAFYQPFGRRVRAIAGDRTILDTENAVMVHTADDIKPVVWFPRTDIDLEHVSADQLTSPAAGSLEATLGDVVVLAFEAADLWLEEDEPMYVHFKDPYHRIDLLHSSKHIEVVIGGEKVADSVRPVLFIETAIPVRYYLPWADIRRGAFTKSDFYTLSPYTGYAQHWHVEIGGVRVENAAWSLPHPYHEGAGVIEHVAFYPNLVEQFVNGVRDNSIGRV